MDKDEEILKRLNEISDNEWINIVDQLTVFVHFKLKGRTLFGAHTEQNLGVNPIDYYVDGAIEKLFRLEWKWQYEKYSLIEQLKLIVGSMLSNNVEKYRNRKETTSPMEEEKLIPLIVSESDNEIDEKYDLFREALEECSKDDEELQLYVMAFDDCNSFDDMAESLGFDKKKLYSLQKKMTRRMTKYLETKKKLKR